MFVNFFGIGMTFVFFFVYLHASNDDHIYGYFKGANTSVYTPTFWIYLVFGMGGLTFFTTFYYAHK